MVSYAKRFLIVFVLAACIGLLFFAGKQSQAASVHLSKQNAPEPAYMGEIRKSQFITELAFPD